MIWPDDYVNKILQGDCLELMKGIPDESVDCCITSPPYWGLRDYGVEGQLGLEKTPEEYVAKMVKVFGEVKRVLKDEGTLWLNLGDTYSAQRWSNKPSTTGISGKQYDVLIEKDTKLPDKNLVGIPWRVAFALQQLYYTGKIKNEMDRIWLAAMIDGEGCIFIHKRKAGTENYASYTKKDGTVTNYNRKQDTYGVGLEVANVHESIIKRCQEITGMGSICRVERETKNKMRNIPLYRWNMRNNECRNIIHEIYPYLVGKKHEARILLNCPSAGEEAAKCHQSLMLLHNGKEALIDYPEPKSLYEDGYYLRQDVIWSKPNCMPESVTDRCTKAHEYIFLLAKSQKYYFDNEAIREPLAYPNETRRPLGSKGAWEMDGRKQRENGGGSHYDGYPSKRNKRSVWTVTVKPCPFRDVHFATFPEDLILPCVLAGCPKDGIVLDPFMGAGTTALVAKTQGRKYIGLELNPEYCKIARARVDVIPERLL